MQACLPSFLLLLMHVHKKVTVRQHVANNTSIGYVFLIYFIYFGIACSSLIQVVNCHDFSHCSSTTPFMQSQLINERKTGSPAESESYGSLSGNYGNLSPAEHPSTKDTFFGAQSLVTNLTTMKSLTEFLNKNSFSACKTDILVCERNSEALLDRLSEASRYLLIFQ